ncbi:MAG: HU family DNA-binding protein [Candidatus Dormibacteraeota bacterium]|jgi:DNA-binding protein HU-beta|nr:HU family DNA-binding protein [Candidatus Dormibacteraeota bacterium]
MNRRELAQTLQAQLLYDGDPNDPVFSNFNFADETLQLIFGLISQKLASGEEVSIAGFGRWRISESPGGMRRNPRTGAPVKVGPSKKVRFYPASALKVAVASKPVRRRATRRPA